MSIARKVLSNTASQFLGRLTTAILSVVVLKLITNYLGKTGYGEYTTVYEVLGFFAIFADMGIYTIAVHELSGNKEKAPYIIGNIMGLRSVLSFVMMLVAVILVFLLPQYSGSFIPIGVAIAAITTFLNLLYGTICSILQVHYKMHYAALALIAGKIVSLIVMLLAIVFLAPTGSQPYFEGVVVMYKTPDLHQEALETGFYLLMGAGVLGTLLMYLITSFVANRFIPFRYRFDVDFWKRVIFRAAPGGIALLLNNIYFRIDVVLLSLVSPSQIAMTQTGVYGVAVRILDLLIVIPVFFMNSVLPIMTRLYEDNKEKFLKVIQYAFDFLVIVGFPIVMGGLILAEGIIRFISNEEFLTANGAYGSDLALRILLFALFFTFLGMLFGFLFIVGRKPKKLLKITFWAVVFNVMATIIGIRFWEFRGAAVSSVISQLLILVFAYRYSKTFIHFNLKMGSFVKSLIGVLLMGITMYGVMKFIDHKYAWFLAGAAGCLVYAGVLWRMKAVDKEILRLLRKT